LDGLAGTSEVMFSTDLWGVGLKTMAMLCIVIAGLLLVLFLMKRFFYQKDGYNQGQLIKMLSSYHVAPKERIALIDVAGEKLVIGITPENISCLAKIEDSEALEKIQGVKALGAGGSGLFERVLKASLKNKGRSSEL